jgi:hypothetical protein
MLPHGYGYPRDSWKLHISGSIPRWLDEFPDVATAAINTLIRKEHARFETSQIRDFVPLLVEKHALRELKHEPSISPNEGSQLVITEAARKRSVVGQPGSVMINNSGSSVEPKRW